MGTTQICPCVVYIKCHSQATDRHCTNLSKCGLQPSYWWAPDKSVHVSLTAELLMGTVQICPSVAYSQAIDAHQTNLSICHLQPSYWWALYKSVHDSLIAKLLMGTAQICPCVTARLDKSTCVQPRYWCALHNLFVCDLQPRYWCAPDAHWTNLFMCDVHSTARVASS